MGTPRVVTPREEGSPGEGRGRSMDSHSVLRLPQPGGVSSGLAVLKNGEIQRKGINVTY